MEAGVDRIQEEPERFAPAIDVATRLLDNIETVVYGKREEVKLVLAALMCGGHVLLEDVPGTAKTVLARAIGGSIEGVSINRIQCTPDLQPTDVTGMSVFDQKTRDFEFRPGPDLHERPARRRDQPGDAEDAVGAARGDGGGAGDGRRRDARAAEPVLPARDREPDRVRGDVPAARGAARPLPPPNRARLPRRARGAADPGGAALPASARRPAARRHARRHPRPPRRGPARLRRRRPAQLDRRSRPRHA